MGRVDPYLTWWPRYGHRVRPQPGAGWAGDGGPDGVWDAPDELTDETMLRPREDHAERGWRAAVTALTGGRVNPGVGERERRDRERRHRITRPLTEAHHIAVASIKGGVGKTTISACLGLVLAEHRGDRVVVLDANPDAGTLADRLTGESQVTVRDLVRDLDRVGSWNDVARYTSLARRLQVVASEQDPAASEAFSRAEYAAVIALLSRYFNITITDSGTGLVHSAMAGTLAAAHSLVIAGAPTVDGASRAAKTLDWLCAHGHDGLVKDAVVVLSQDRSSREVDVAAVTRHFRSRCREVVQVPHDPHLATGARVELARLRPGTREAFTELAALISDRF